MKTHCSHGNADSYQALIGTWKVSNRERKYLHTVHYARRIFYRFAGHTHPYAQKLVSELLAGDIEGLQRLDTDVDLRSPYFSKDYAPARTVAEIDTALDGASVAVFAPRKVSSTLEDEGLPVNDLDFDYQSGAYAVYNWEVFYHVPYLVAIHLSKNGWYAEAQRWFHYIFDPTDNSDPAEGPKRFWKFKPFRVDEVEHIEEVLFNVATGDDALARDATVRAIGAWRDLPFRPHLVARTRPTAYMYATVMAYLDNLIAWGDSLFRQDTRESINEATQLYVLAANILGPRPQVVPPRGTAKKQTYSSLKNKLDEFGNAAVALEAEIAFDLFPPHETGKDRPEHAVLESVGRSLYFCIPRNEKFIGYWDTVGDRLFKIRNSLNLQGTFRQLPLFAPPIDPAMLARAIAAGVDIRAVIDGSTESPAPVRCQFLLQKALEMAQEVKSLGAQVLAALEKKDGETLGILRARHEVNMLVLAEAVKYTQWQEAIKNREGMEANLQTVFQRFRHYERLSGTADSAIKLPDHEKFDRKKFEERMSGFDDPKVYAPDVSIQVASGSGGHNLSGGEAHELDVMDISQTVRELSKSLALMGSIVNQVPDFDTSVKPFWVGAGFTFGGSILGNIFSALGLSSERFADKLGNEAGMAGRMASFGRREQDWAFQRKQAACELTQLYKQYRSAELREHIAERDYENHTSQIQQSKDVLEFLTNEENRLTGDRRKTGTEDFYLWMKREAQGLHTKCFEFAFDVAKKAEKAIQNELGDVNLAFVKDSYRAGREGLFAGEKLYLDLKRLEMKYAEANSRDYEITKHVSLKEWFPLKLIDLRNDGECDFDLPEALFDLDCPGHKQRRIKSVALTLPCVVGPYASVNCLLSLVGQSYVRYGSGGYDGSNPQEDSVNFRDCKVAVKAVVTSGAQNDSGLFETNLRDERYLPFEGAGVVSSWRLKILGTPRSFDYDSIADAILTIRYTAKDGGDESLARNTAEGWLSSNSARLFSMRHEFASEWARFKQSVPVEGEKATLRFRLEQTHFPYRMEKLTEQPKRLHLFFTGNVSGDVELWRSKTRIGTTQLLNGVTFDENGFDASGDFELRFDSTELDDLWVVIDWSTEKTEV